MSTEGERNLAFDPARKFVRVRERRPDGRIAFDFAVGEPELFVEMLMDEAVFEDFCAANDAALLPDVPEESDREAVEWRLSEQSGKQFKKR